MKKKNHNSANKINDVQTDVSLSHNNAIYYRRNDVRKNSKFDIFLGNSVGNQTNGCFFHSQMK